jgi:hypothetical protein
MSTSPSSTAPVGNIDAALSMRLLVSSAADTTHAVTVPTLAQHIESASPINKDHERVDWHTDVGAPNLRAILKENEREIAKMPHEDITSRDEVGAHIHIDCTHVIRVDSCAHLLCARVW